jgi:1,4-alpha-glucan branching enzyme
LNFANRAYTNYAMGFPRHGTWHLRFNSDWVGYSPDFGNHYGYDALAEWGGMDDLPCWGNVGIGPYTALVFSQ